MLLHLTLPMNLFLWSCTNRIKINLLKLSPEVRVKIHWGRTLLVTVFSFRKAKSVFYGFSYSSKVLFQISLIMVVDATNNFTVSNFFLSYDLELFAILHPFSLGPERALSPTCHGIFVFRRTDSPSGIFPGAPTPFVMEISGSLKIIFTVLILPCITYLLEK